MLLVYTGLTRLFPNDYSLTPTQNNNINCQGDHVVGVHVVDFLVVDLAEG